MLLLLLFLVEILVLLVVGFVESVFIVLLFTEEESLVEYVDLVIVTGVPFILSLLPAILFTLPLFSPNMSIFFWGHEAYIYIE